MTDIFSKEQRHKVMSRISSKDTSIEKILRSKLFALGFRFRKNLKSLPGSPDIVLHKYKTVIFIHGCFWHNHKDCKDGSIPKTRVAYWKKKFSRNKKRDKEQMEELVKLGWNVLVVWGCELKRDINGVIRSLNHILKEIIPASNQYKVLMPELSCFIKPLEKKN